MIEVLYIETPITHKCVTLLVAAIILLGASSASRILSNFGVYSDPKKLSTPTAIFSFFGKLDVTLELRIHYFDSEIFSFRTRAYCIDDDRCSIPGPTLYCKPGDFITVKIKNSLPLGPSAAETPNIYFRGIDAASQLFSAGSGREVLTLEGIAQGDTVTLTVRVPIDQHPGIHSYQSMVPDSSSLALWLIGGLYGAIVVQPTSIVDIPTSISSLNRLVVVLSHVNLLTEGFDDDARNSVSAFYSPGAATWSYPSLSTNISTIDISISLIPVPHFYIDRASQRIVNISSVIPDSWLTNGQYQPYLTLKAGEWIVLDILSASADRYLELEVRSQIGFGQGNGSICTMNLLAMDGVYLERSRLTSHLVLLPGSRSSVAFMCPRAGTFYLQTVAVIDDGSPDLSKYVRIGDLDTKSSQNLLTLIIMGSNTTLAINEELESPVDLSEIPRPARLRSLMRASGSLRKEEASLNWSIAIDNSGCCGNMTSSSSPRPPTAWLGIGRDCALQCFDDFECTNMYGMGYSMAQVAASINHRCVYSPHSSSRHTIPMTGEVAALSVWRRVPFLYPLFSSQHFQIVSHNNKNRGGRLYGPYRSVGLDDLHLYAEIGDWRDTIPAVLGLLTLLANFSNAAIGVQIVGNAILPLSDEGMLATFGVDAAAPSLIPVQRPTAAVPDTAIVQPLPSTQFCDASGLSWQYSEVLDSHSGARVITISSCPNHFSECQDEQCEGVGASIATLVTQKINVPLYPKIASNPVDTTCSLDAIGVAFSGVEFRSPGMRLPTYPQIVQSTCVSPDEYTRITGEQPTTWRTKCDLNGDQDGILYCGDSVSSDLSTKLDKCGGRVDSASGRYFYSVPPVCLLQHLDELRRNKTVGALADFRVSENGLTVGMMSPQIGWALDGFPIYGPMGPGGILMTPCKRPGAHPSICLDQCNGLRGFLPNVDDFAYRYFVSGPVATGNCSSKVSGLPSNSLPGTCERHTEKCCISNVPEASFFPYTIGCFAGCTISDTQCRASAVADGTSDAYVPTPHISILNQFSSIVVTKPTSPKQHETNYSSISHKSLSSSSVNESDARRAARTAYYQQIQLVDTKIGAEQATKTFAVRLANRSLAIMQSRLGVPDIHIEALPMSSEDMDIAGMALSPDAKFIFIASPTRGLFAMRNNGSRLTNVMSSLLAVKIIGINLAGTDASDHPTIEILGKPCTSIRIYNASFVSCICISLTAFDATSLVSASDVRLLRRGGEVIGLSVEPFTDIKSGNGRPAIFAVELESIPFSPNSVAVSPTVLLNLMDSGEATSASGSSAYILYVANGARENTALGYSVLRLRGDGRHVEVVAEGLSGAAGVAVRAAIHSSHTEDVFVSNPQAGRVEWLKVPLFALLPKYAATTASTTSTHACPPSQLESSPILVGLKRTLSPQAIAYDSFGDSLYVTLSKTIIVRVDLMTALSTSANISIGLSSSELGLPSWASVIYRASDSSRLTSLCVAPKIDSDRVGGWKQQRIVSVDTSQNYLNFFTDSGSPFGLLKTMESESPFKPTPFWAVWPSACAITTNVFGSQVTQTVYVSEFLGKVWRMQFDLDESGLVDISHIPLPALLLDASSYPAGQRLRTILEPGPGPSEESTVSSLTVNDVFFDITS